MAAALGGLGLADLLTGALRRELGDDADAPALLGPGEAAPAGAEVLAVVGIGPEELAAQLTPDVRWVHVLATGVDGFPIDLLGDRMLSCSRGASATAIAEFSLAAMLAFEKQLPEIWLHEPPPRWNQARLGTLYGRSLGLVGLGAIATETARRALPFGMEVRAYRRTGAPALLAEVAVTDSLEDLLGRADHVLVAAPATPGPGTSSARGALRALRPGAHLLNVSRGSLLDHDALRTALDDGRVARATLDVTDPEPLPAGHWLYRHPRVRLSAHVSWSAPNTLATTMDLFAQNVRRYRDGEDLVGRVDVDAGY